MAALPGYDSFVFAGPGKKRTVYHRGEGPGVILVHELPGMSEACVCLGNEIAERGFCVYLPLLFGRPNHSLEGAWNLARIARFCITREFRLFAKHEQGGFAEWLRALCRKVHEDRGGKGVGVMGMCLTGGFALSAVVEPKVMAAVASQPALPMTIFPLPGNERRRSSSGISEKDLDLIADRTQGGLPIIGFRFTEDPWCTVKRFDSLERRLGKNFERYEISSGKENGSDIPDDAHSVFNVPYGRDGKPHDEQTKARARLFAYLETQLAG